MVNTLYNTNILYNISLYKSSIKSECDDMYITKKPERINKLRDYYRNNSKMVTDENVVCWKCHRSLMLYLEGWEKNVCNTDTARIRRSAAESYMLENTKPVIIPGE